MKAKYYLISLIAMSTAIFMSACGDSDKSANNNDLTQIRLYCENQYRGDQMLIDQCVRDRLSYNVNGTTTQLAWYAKLNVTDYGVYKDFLRSRRVCGTGNINYQYNILIGGGNLDDCDELDHTVGVIVNMDALTSTTPASARFFRVINDLPFYNYIDAYFNFDYNTLGSMDKFANSPYLTIPLQALKPATANTELVIESNGARVAIQGTAVSKGPLSVKLYFNGIVYASGNIDFLDDQSSNNDYYYCPPGMRCY